jgi:hypothetical protein
MRESIFRRGQTDSTVLIGIAVAVIVAVLIIYFVYTGFDLFGGAVKAAPDKVQTNLATCESLMKGLPTTKYSLCSQVRELGKNFYGTCLYEPIRSEIGLSAKICYENYEEESYPTELIEIVKEDCKKIEVQEEVKINDKTRFNGVLCIPPKKESAE